MGKCPLPGPLVLPRSKRSERGSDLATSLATEIRGAYHFRFAFIQAARKFFRRGEQVVSSRIQRERREKLDPFKSIISMSYWRTRQDSNL